MMKAGKALNERKTEIRVQFKPPTAPIHGEAENMRNELVVRTSYPYGTKMSILKMTSVFLTYAFNAPPQYHHVLSPMHTGLLCTLCLGYIRAWCQSEQS